MPGVRRRDWLRGVGCGLTYAAIARARNGVRPLSVGELWAGSAAVCTATLTVKEAQWISVFGQRRIVTTWQVNDPDVFGGEVATSSRLMTLGGVVDDVQQWVPHEAKLGEGQKQLLFLMQGPLGSFWVTGMLQGAYAFSSAASDAALVLTSEQREIAREPASACAVLQERSLQFVKELMASHVRS